MLGRRERERERKEEGTRALEEIGKKELSQFISLLVSITPLAIDLLDYSPFSILIVPNAYLASDDYFSHHHHSLAVLADFLLYHVLL
ncbi:hypothetical protein JHK86_053679 [Glycine max]|nr:hypothetical protein JHK86_053679 [Glycine max]